MSERVPFEFVNLFCAGILAGMELGIHYGLPALTEVLDEQAQLRFRQALIRRLRVLIPAFFVPTTVSAIAVMILDGGAPGFWCRCAGVIAFLIWIVIRVIGTVPINSATLTWQVDAPPRDWPARVNHAERFHVFGVWAAVGAFGFFLAGEALRLAGR